MYYGQHFNHTDFLQREFSWLMIPREGWKTTEVSIAAHQFSKALSKFINCPENAENTLNALEGLKAFKEAVDWQKAQETLPI